MNRTALLITAGVLGVTLSAATIPIAATLAPTLTPAVPTSEPTAQPTAEPAPHHEHATLQDCVNALKRYNSVPGQRWQTCSYIQEHRTVAEFDSMWLPENQ